MFHSPRVVLGIGLLLHGFLVSAQAPSYTAQFLGTATTVASLSNAGVAVGWRTISGGSVRGWVAGVGQGMLDLPLPPGYVSSFAADINAAGAVCGTVGTSFTPEIAGRPVLWTPNGAGGYSVQLLPLLPGTTEGAASALNDVGDVVGTCKSGLFTRPTLFSAPGGPLDLSATGVSGPKAINNQRVLVDGSFSPKRLDLDTVSVENLGVPTGLPSNYVGVYAYDINEPGQVAGAALLATSTSCSQQAARYTDGVGWQILSGCGKYNAAYELNAAGDTVMQIASSIWVRLEGFGSYNLQNQIDTSQGQWFLWTSFGNGINDAGDVAVMASNQSTGQSGAVLLHRTDSCQTNLGYGGPGSSYASMCGGDLSSGSTAQLKLVGAAPLQPAVLVVGSTNNPLPLFGGTVVPLQSALLLLPFLTSASGSVTQGPILGGGGPFTLYGQFGYLDPSLPQSVGLSNALEIEFLP